MSYEGKKKEREGIIWLWSLQAKESPIFTLMTFDFRVYLEKALDKVLGGVFNFGKEKQESLEGMFILKTRTEERHEH